MSTSPICAEREARAQIWGRSARAARRVGASTAEREGFPAVLAARRAAALLGGLTGGFERLAARCPSLSGVGSPARNPPSLRLATRAGRNPAGQVRIPPQWVALASS